MSTSKKKLCTLLDLCADDKARVGQLVKTLQQRRIRILQLQKVSQKNQDEIKNLKQELQSRQSYFQSQIIGLKQEFNHKLQLKQQIIQQQHQKTSNKQSCSTNTITIQRIDQSTAIKIEQKTVQTQIKQKFKSESSQTTETSLYGLHSRTYERVMNNTDFEAEEEQNQAEKLQIITQRLLKEKQKNLHALQKQYKQCKSNTKRNYFQNNTIRNTDGSEWKDRKTKNLTTYQQLNSPYSQGKQQSEERYIQQNQEISDEFYGSEFKMQEQNQKNNSNPLGIDDIQLNKLLKSSNFSAKKLLSKSKEKSRSKQIVKNSLESSPKKLSKYIKNTSQQSDLNFYGSELLDIVDSL